jgi:hypothetical protein
MTLFAIAKTKRFYKWKTERGFAWTGDVERARLFKTETEAQDRARNDGLGAVRIVSVEVEEE